LAKWVTGQLIKTGTVQRAYLGVAIGEISPQMAEKFGVSRGKGVVVSEVMPNTPAAEAGVREGDVILSFAGQAVGTPRQLQEVVERAPIGSKQTLEVWRDGKPLTISVTMQALPQDFTAKGRQPGRGPAGTTFESAELGLAVTEMSEQMAERLGYKGFSGVLISEVKPGGLADLAGLREGMLILKVGKKAVTSVAEFRTALEGESVRAGILLLVRTQAGNRFVLLKRE
jgi:serine protease Do